MPPRDGPRVVGAVAVGDDDSDRPVGRLGVDARKRRVQVGRLVACGDDEAHDRRRHHRNLTVEIYKWRGGSGGVGREPIA